MRADGGGGEKELTPQVYTGSAYLLLRQGPLSDGILQVLRRSESLGEVLREFMELRIT